MISQLEKMQQPKVCLQNIDDIISYTVSSYCNFQIGIQKCFSAVFQSDLIMIQKCVLKMGLDMDSYRNRWNTPTLIFSEIWNH